jgi:hypothetical protein
MAASLATRTALALILTTTEHPPTVADKSSPGPPPVTRGTGHQTGAR